MADNVDLTSPAGSAAADELVDGVLGTVKFQYVKLVDGAIGGSGKIGGDATNGLDVDVTRLPALVAGTAAIGKLAANSGVDIGDVDVTSLAPGVAATSLGKAEDAAHASGDTGVAILGVRRDTAASGAGTDGDYATLNLDATGHLYVHVKDTQLDGSTYETVAASVTAQVLGGAGAIGDYISQVVITPSSTTVGVVTLIDNATSIPLMAAGTLSNTAPITIPLGFVSVSGAWKITTGAAVTVVAVGTFT